MAEKYKLTYFDARARAEPIRLLLALAEVKYEDNRFGFPDWPALKPTTPWGTVPVLEVNGQEFGEILAIQKYFTKKYGFGGKTPLEEFKVDEIISALFEVPKIYSWFIEKDPVKKEQEGKAYIARTKDLLKKTTVLKEKNGGKWLVGQNVTLADIHVAYSLDCVDMVDPTITPQFPVLKKLQKDVYDIPQIKKWIETRPKNIL